jgi:hypothetical protein
MSNTSNGGILFIRASAITIAPHFRALTQGTIMKERKALGTQFCPQYHTEVEFFIETSAETGRALVARYQDGGRKTCRLSKADASSGPAYLMRGRKTI